MVLMLGIIHAMYFAEIAEDINNAKAGGARVYHFVVLIWFDVRRRLRWP